MFRSSWALALILCALTAGQVTASSRIRPTREQLKNIVRELNSVIPIYKTRKDLKLSHDVYGEPLVAGLLLDAKHQFEKGDRKAAMERVLSFIDVARNRIKKEIHQVPNPVGLSSELMDIYLDLQIDLAEEMGEHASKQLDKPTESLNISLDDLNDFTRGKRK